MHELENLFLQCSFFTAEIVTHWMRDDILLLGTTFIAEAQLEL